MKQRYSIVTSLFFTLNLAVPFSSYAAGFPVVDVASIAQQYSLYLHMLDDYVTQLNQLNSLDSQYKQMLVDYQQTMTEYEKFLNQVTSLMKRFPDTDWSQLSSVSQSHYGSGLLASIPQLTLTHSESQQQLSHVMKSYGTYVAPADESNQSWNDVGLKVNASHPLGLGAQRNDINASRQRDIYEQVANNQEQATKRQEVIQRHNDMLHHLGNESDLATLQLMASQNQLMMDQFEAVDTTLNQLLLSQESPHAIEAEKHYQGQQLELQRLRRETSTTPKPMGRERWGDL